MLSIYSKLYNSTVYVCRYIYTVASYIYNAELQYFIKYFHIYIKYFKSTGLFKVEFLQVQCKLVGPEKK